MSLDESWQRYPEARIRMREQDLTILIGALQKNGICIAGQPRIQLLDDGILISLNTNSGKWGKLIALPIDVFIPCEVPREQEEQEGSDGAEDADGPGGGGDDLQAQGPAEGAGSGEL